MKHTTLLSDRNRLVSFSAFGQQLAITVCNLEESSLGNFPYNAAVELWNTESHKLVETVSLQMNEVCQTVMLSARQFLSAGYQDAGGPSYGRSGKCLQLYDLNKGRDACRVKLTLHTDQAEDIFISVLPNEVVACSGEIWDLEREHRLSRLQEIDQTTTHGDYAAETYAVLPSGQLASAFFSGCTRYFGETVKHLSNPIKIWDMRTMRPSLKIPLPLNGDVSHLCAISENVLASCYRGEIIFWDLRKKGTVLAKMAGTSYLADAVTLLQDRQRIVSFGKIPHNHQPAIKIWNTETQRSQETFESSGEFSFDCRRNLCSILPDGRLVVTDPKNKTWGQKNIFLYEIPQLMRQSAAVRPSSALAAAASTAAAAVSSVFSTGLLSIPFSDLALEDRLGQGGFGVVYKAKWKFTPVAVKMLRDDISVTDSVLEEFKKEAKQHSLLRHPNIIALYGVCLESRKYAMVIQLMPKGSLYDILHSGQDLPWRIRLSIAQDIIQGLFFLHTRRIIHRDMKSLNVLLDGNMRARISDFGLAKLKTTSSSMTSGPMGTWAWMAPELLEGGSCSEASDVYSTAIVLWEIASRAQPHKEADNVFQLMARVKQGVRDPIPPGTPPGFASLITKCWDGRRELRPSTKELAEQVMRLTV